MRRHTILLICSALALLLTSGCSYISYKVGKRITAPKKTGAAPLNYEEGEKLRILLTDSTIRTGTFNAEATRADTLCLALELEQACFPIDRVRKIKSLASKEKNIGLMVGIGIDIFIIYYTLIAWLALSN